uniref:ARAD1D46288p n=1 Tax=Blastobotrys adeninivorans TaxID=409370 RepID=A0A060TDR8_BLAAD
MPGLFERYKALPRNVRLYIGVSTLVVAIAGDRITRKIEEDREIRAEAERRLEEQERMAK